MRGYTSPSIQPRFRFRRWSRSRAAVFNSLTGMVIIGHLSANVVERLTGKSTSALGRCERRWVQQEYSQADSEPKERDFEPLELVLLILESQSFAAFSNQALGLPRPPLGLSTFIVLVLSLLRRA